MENDSDNSTRAWSSLGREPHLSVIGVSYAKTELSHMMRFPERVEQKLVPRAGVEPARPYGQRILSPVAVVQPNLMKHYKPVFTRLAVVKVSLKLA